jgi:hypothetical protein
VKEGDSLVQWQHLGHFPPSGASRRGCFNDTNSFCYICGCYVIKKQERNITPFFKNMYFAHLKIKLGGQDKKLAPRVVCQTRAGNLRQLFRGIHSSVPFSVPTVSREPHNH